MATFRVGDLIKEQPDGSRALQTQLTGSNVEDGIPISNHKSIVQEILFDSSVPGGSHVDVTINTKILHPYIVVGVYMPSRNSNDFQIDVAWRGDEGNAFTGL